MFVHYYGYVEDGFAAAEDRLVGAPSDWLPNHVRTAAGADAIRSRLGLGPRFPFSKHVDVDVGAPMRALDRTVVPLEIRATGADALFPRLDAQLELAAVGPDLCQLTLQGTYDPPLGSVGEGIDRLLMHRIAEASIKRFVDQVAAALTA